MVNSELLSIICCYLQGKPRAIYIPIMKQQAVHSDHLFIAHGQTQTWPLSIDIQARLICMGFSIMSCVHAWSGIVQSTISLFAIIIFAVKVNNL